MTVIYILLVLIVIGLILVYLDYKECLVFCCKCKSKMNRRFILEEDCEEYTCPNCGHKFKVHG